MSFEKNQSQEKAKMWPRPYYNVGDSEKGDPDSGLVQPQITV